MNNHSQSGITDQEVLNDKTLQEYLNRARKEAERPKHMVANKGMLEKLNKIIRNLHALCKEDDSTYSIDINEYSVLPTWLYVTVTLNSLGVNADFHSLLISTLAETSSFSLLPLVTGEIEMGFGIEDFFKESK